MPTQHQRLAAAYTPEPDRPRKRGRAWAALTRDLKARDIVVALVGVLVALGYVFDSPGKRLTALEARVATNEKTIASLAEQQRFTNYMLCMNARRTDPASAPPDCTPIIDARKPK